MKNNWKKIFIIAMCMMMIVGSSLTVNAKPRTGKYVDAQGHIYIYDKNGRPKTGYFTYRGKHYYGHKTSTKKYPKGSVTVSLVKSLPLLFYQIKGEQNYDHEPEESTVRFWQPRP